MKISQLIEYNKRNIFFKIHAENETGRLLPDLFLLLKIFYLKSKQVVCSLVSTSLDSSQLDIQ